MVTNIAAMGLRAVYWAKLWRNFAFYLNPTHKQPKTHKYKSTFQQLVLGVSCYGEMILVLVGLRNLLLRLLHKSQWSGAEQYLLCAPCIERLRLEDSTTETVSAWATELTRTWSKQYSQTPNYRHWNWCSCYIISSTIPYVHMCPLTLTTKLNLYYFQPSSSSLDTY